jgi:hypothetical protein
MEGKTHFNGNLPRPTAMYDDSEDSPCPNQ